MKLIQIFRREQNLPTLLNINNNLKWIVFLDILKTQQHVKLFEGYSEHKKYSEKEIQLSSEAWVALQDELFLLEDSVDLRALVKKSIDKLLLAERIRLIEDWGDLLAWYGNKFEFFKSENKVSEFDKGVQGIYADLKKHFPKLKIQYFAKIDENLKLIERLALAFINEYTTKHKDIETKVKKIERSIFYDVHQVNIITGLSLNANEMVCAEWLEAKKIAKEINSRNSKPTTDGV